MKDNFTLEELEKSIWPDPPLVSYLTTTCYQLRKKPLSEFEVEDLRIMIGQGFGLPYLLPMAIEVLRKDPLAEGDFYPGDLLLAVLRVPKGALDLKPDQLNLLRQACRLALEADNPGLPMEMRPIVEAFLGGAWTDDPR